MRLRNFCMQMGFALFVSLILIVFFHNVSLAVLYVVGHLVWAFLGDRKTVYAEKQKNIRRKIPYQFNA